MRVSNNRNVAVNHSITLFISSLTWVENWEQGRRTTGIRAAGEVRQLVYSILNV